MPHESTVDREHAGPVEVDGSHAFLPRNRNFSMTDASVEAATAPAAATPQAATPVTAKQAPAKEPSKQPVVVGADVKQPAAASAVAAATLPTADSNRPIVGKAKTPRQSTFVYEEESDEESPKSSNRGSGGEDDSKTESPNKKNRKKEDPKRNRFDSENEREATPGAATTHVSEYEDVVVPQTSVVEQLPKQNADI